ncbi:MAG: hypothetical protein ACJAYF_002587 [Arenicella sp.]|jgi:hypothetical protein
MKLAGYSYLIEKLGLKVPALKLVLALGDKKHDEIRPYGVSQVKFLAKTKKVGDTLPEHIETAIQHQGVRLQYLVPIFQVLDASELTDFIKEKPMSSVRRCIWYLYEWLTETELSIPDSNAHYTPLLDDKYYYTLENGHRNSRTRVINNFIGTKEFCPVIRKTPEILKCAEKNLMDLALAKLVSLDGKVNTETLGRSVAYLYTKETKSSTDIEKEDSHSSKTTKFYRVLKNSGTLPLNRRRLIDIQNKIVRSDKKDVGYRSDEIYVGESRLSWLDGQEENIHFIGPMQKHVEGMMSGWLETHNNILLDQNLPPMIHAGLLSFGFVYIHPFSDGNGRIHRYVIHDVLKARHSSLDRDFIIPVSAAILARPSKYDQVLEEISKPVMALLDYELDPSDNSITISSDLDYLYRYPDLTSHVLFLYDMMETAISEDLVKEVTYIIKYDLVKAIIEALYDLPNKNLDLLIRLAVQNDGKIAVSKRKRFYGWIPETDLVQLEQLISKALKEIKSD